MLYIPTLSVEDLWQTFEHVLTGKAQVQLVALNKDRYLFFPLSGVSRFRGSDLMHIVSLTKVPDTLEC